ncbi:MAG: hypothetical protein DRN33_02450 [Thermoplasmata archaeon]|nr:MAG: hypothetical protein DRN33_02450 [Thermoplasmata archaeon]
MILLMTADAELKIYEQGLEDYPKRKAFFGNIVMIFWISLGAIACWFVHPIAAFIYLLFAVIMIYVVLRKLVCTNCYYYDKWCGIGWGKLSALLFKKGDIKEFNTSIGIQMAPIVYGLLSMIPIVLLVISIFQQFSMYKISVLILILLISSYSGVVSRKKTCGECKMRLICPGSAVKKEM